MSDSMAAGARVALAIGVIKWVLIAIAIVSAGVSILVPLLDPSTAKYTLAIGVAAAFGCLVWILFIWVLFGWFEHTLAALVTIARNTAPHVPVTYDVPPAAYDRPRG